MTSVVISGSGVSLPPNVLDNAALVAAFNARAEAYNQLHADAIAAGQVSPRPLSSAAFIEKASGIYQRHLVSAQGLLGPGPLIPEFPHRDESECSLQAELGIAAARQALAAAQLTAADIDTVIAASSAFQRQFPALSIEIQQALGIQGHAYDMNVACSSGVFALSNARDALVAGSSRRVLLVVPEIPSGYVAWEDRDSHFIFGDVGVALVIERRDTCRIPQPFEIKHTQLFTQFSQAIRLDTGHLTHAILPRPTARETLFRQEGRRVFKEVCGAVASLIHEQLVGQGLTGQDLSCLWLHQANANMNDYIARKVLGDPYDPARAPTVLATIGNTASAGSLVAFDAHRAEVPAGGWAVMAAFGAGYSIGSVLLRRCDD